MWEEVKKEKREGGREEGVSECGRRREREGGGGE